MNFQRGQSRDEPEINLIPLIDVLLVILIFLMVTTSYAKFSELQINLPQAGGDATVAEAKPIKPQQDRFVSSAMEGEAQPQQGKSTKTAEAAVPTGGNATAPAQPAQPQK